jgi:drug/metabolite transporter (DMT)-like permease
VAILGLACTALALVLFLFLISEAGASRAAVITYLNPAIAVLLGVSVLGEHLGGGSIAGLFMILLGSWLATARDATSNAVRSASIERPRFDAGPERRSR